MTDLEAEQTALTEVLVTWTAPSPVPPRGYRVTVASANYIDTSGTSHTLTISQPGVHTIQVQSLSRHYPGEVVSVEVTVRGTAVRTIFLWCYIFFNLYAGILLPVVNISSLTATSAYISWTQPVSEYSLPVVQYTVSLTRVTGSGQVLCPSISDQRPVVITNGTSTSFTGLEEFSVYTVIVNAIFNKFDAQRTVDMNFTSLSHGRCNEIYGSPNVSNSNEF